MNDYSAKNYMNSSGKLDSNKIRKITIPAPYSFFCRSASEFLYLNENNLMQQPKCTCGKTVRFISFVDGYKTYCGQKCANSCPLKIQNFRDTMNQIEENGLSKAKNNSIVAMQTCIEKYGKPIYLATEQGIKDVKQTKLERYGNENYNNMEKNKKTCLERYGKESYSSTEMFPMQVKQTKLERYGNENYNNLEQMKKTCIENFGVENPRYSDIVNEKIQTNRRKTMEEKGTMIPLDQKTEFYLYKKQVMKITESNDLSQLEHIEKRGMAGIPGAYHLDHKISIFYGFTNKISVDIIGHIENLRMIPWEENYKKGKNNA